MSSQKQCPFSVNSTFRFVFFLNVESLGKVTYDEKYLRQPKSDLLLYVNLPIKTPKYSVISLFEKSIANSNCGWGNKKREANGVLKYL